jgi:ketosteroid isomerase-like protein
MPRTQEELMQRKLYSAVTVALMLMTTLAFAQDKKGAAKSAAGIPDKAHLQKIWDAWSTLDPANPAPFYASGSHVYYDIAPLKYASWDEYQKGVVAVLAGFKSAKLTVNDDAQIHTAGPIVWATATVKEDAILKSGKSEMGNFRWTVVFEKQNGKWLIVHEHISEPAQ